MVESTPMLIHPFTVYEDRDNYLKKVVSARITVSHFPMPDSHPASQIAGTWITESKYREETIPTAVDGRPFAETAIRLTW